MVYGRPKFIGLFGPDVSARPALSWPVVPELPKVLDSGIYLQSYVELESLYDLEYTP